MPSKSIIEEKYECYFCGSQYQLEHHHCIKGNANRKLADEDGLWVWLCRKHHEVLHGKNGHDMDEALKKLAEWCWLERNGYIEEGTPAEDGITVWIHRYGKNWL